jgi:hypothetical protein
MNPEKKRELKRIHKYGCRCNERLQSKTEGSTRFTGGLGHLKIETRLSKRREEEIPIDSGIGLSITIDK